MKAQQLIAERPYAIGLAVTATVSADRTIAREGDTSEASASLREDEDHRAEDGDKQVERNIVLVEADHHRRWAS